jgi:hypothetical protein
MVNVCPPTFKVPDLALPVKFSLSSKLTVAFPVPLSPEVITIQLSLAVAAQLQVFRPDTVTLPLPPLAEKN